MFARPDVDVINRSGGIGRAGYTGNREGIEDFAQRVLERVILVYNKPIACYSAAAGTIHVNDYAGAEMLRRNRQLGPPYRDTINSFVWWLPDGTVNTVLAPSANLETDSRYKPQDITWPDGKRYMWDNGKLNALRTAMSLARTTRRRSQWSAACWQTSSAKRSGNTSATTPIA